MRRSRRFVPILSGDCRKKKNVCVKHLFEKKKNIRVYRCLSVVLHFSFFSKTKKNVPVELTLRERGFFSFYEYILNLTKQSYFADAHTFAKHSRLLFL